ncbi:hypothetical protein GCM10022251_77210 [Phytohabitans flavus]|uniref:Uncharacterized protein n=1 Tax=Phytohabitans flavus TaxID=1076124 RepID=A0A6F8XLK2_9ACTN|nr:hypothetical protein [Phytohabitans flavus]BCB74704.1 hypothetical protein Pflav_011140 [Phytohabitans flavus]
MLKDGVRVSLDPKLVEYLWVDDESYASGLLDEILTFAGAHTAPADLRRAREVVREDGDLTSLVEAKPGLAYGLLRAPDLADLFAADKRLQALFNGPDADLVSGTLNELPHVFRWMRDRPEMRADYVSFSQMRFNLSHADVAELARQNPVWFTLVQSFTRFVVKIQSDPVVEILVQGSRSISDALMRDGEAAADLLLPPEGDAKVKFASEGLARLLEFYATPGSPNRNENVVKVVVGSLSAMRFFAANPRRIRQLAWQPGLAEVLAALPYGLESVGFEAVFADDLLTSLRRYPEQVRNVFATLDVLRLAVAVPSVVPAMAEVDGLADALLESEGVRGLVREQPRVLEALKSSAGDELLQAMRGWPGLVSFLSKDEDLGLVLERPFLVPVLRRNRKILSLLSDRAWRAVLSNRALAEALGSAELRQLLRRPALLEVLSRTTADPGSDRAPGRHGPVVGSWHTAESWRDVLRKPYLVALLDRSQDFATLFLTDAQVWGWYQSNSELLVDAVSRVGQEGRRIDRDSLRTALGQALPAPARVAAVSSRPRGVAAVPARRDTPVDVSAVRVESAAGSSALEWWLRDLAGSEELRELLAAPGRRDVVAAVVEQPHLLVLFGARPDIAAEWVEVPDSVSAFGFTPSDAERRDFWPAYEDLINRRDLQIPDVWSAVMQEQAKVSWERAVVAWRGEQAAEAERRRQRFARINWERPDTWEMSGRILFGNGLGPEWFSQGTRKEVLDRAAQGVGARERAKKLFVALHAHLDSGSEGVTFVYVLAPDGRVDILVYGVSDNRSGNRYEWLGTGEGFTDGPLDISFVSLDPQFVQARERWARREELARADGQSSPAQPERHNAGRLDRVGQALLRYRDAREKLRAAEAAAPAVAKGKGNAKRAKQQARKEAELQALRDAVRQAEDELRAVGLAELVDQPATTFESSSTAGKDRGSSGTAPDAPVPYAPWGSTADTAGTAPGPRTYRVPTPTPARPEPE